MSQPQPQTLGDIIRMYNAAVLNSQSPNLPGSTHVIFDFTWGYGVIIVLI